MFCMADTYRCRFRYWLLLLSVLWVISLVGHFIIDTAGFSVSDAAANLHGGFMLVEPPKLINQYAPLIPGGMTDLRAQDWTPPTPLRPPIAC